MAGFENDILKSVSQTSNVRDPEAVANGREITPEVDAGDFF